MLHRYLSLIISIVLVMAPLFANAQTSCPLVTKNLSLGSQDQQVILLKRYLVGLGLMSQNQYSAYFGPLTETALKKWQTNKGIVSSGTRASTGYGATGPRTRAALVACNKSGTSSTSNSSILGIGSTGEGVFALQRQLILSKLLTADSLTGYYGALTKEAHRKYILLLSSTNSATAGSGGANGAVVSIVPNQSSSVSQTYTWTTGEWTDCVSLIQSRSVMCQDSSNTAVADLFCASQKPPIKHLCIAAASASCTFNSQTIAHGASVTAYQSATVAQGQSCSSISQTRTCSNGTLSGSYINASCTEQASQTPSSIRMSDYFPTGPLTITYRKADGADYLKHVIDPIDPRASIVPQTNPGTHYVLHDWIGGSYADTWHMLNGNDGSVSEIADSYPSVSGCAFPCYGRIATYNDQPIGHGPPGNINVSSPPYVNQVIHMWYSNDGIAPAVFRSDLNAWSSVQLVAIYGMYSPEYGSANGSFHVGGGATYHNVIQVLFGHGGAYTGLVEPHCPNQPASTPHVAGHSSFWQRLWLAPGVGWIKIENLYYEPSCAGTLTDAPTNWVAYLDTTSTALPYTSTPPACTNPAPQVAVNTCQEVGYPGGYTGSYTSTRQLNCQTGQYSEWVRSDTCHL